MRFAIALLLCFFSSLSHAASEDCERAILDVAVSGQKFGEASQKEISALDTLDNNMDDSKTGELKSIAAKAKSQRLETQKWTIAALDRASSVCN